MLLLSVETSCNEGGVALLAAERDAAARLLHERSLSSAGRRHAQSLLKEVAELLTAYGGEPGDVDVVAVSVGPGSFTGLRVGVTFAKLWSYATGGEVVAVDTLRAAAEQAPPEIERVFAIADAQQGGLYVGEYRRPTGAPRVGDEDSSGSNLAGSVRAGSIRTLAAEEFAAQLSASDYLTGPGLSRYAARFEPVCRIAPPDERFPRAETIGLIGLQSAVKGDYADAWTLEPFYIRKSGAEEKREREESSAATESREER